ncbi:MAG: Asp-tRNA(Asn)/Glu-tRNA(Gln) amidotransferase subunit GatB [Planctomycetota bacterium]|nr:Asp-tRNA(Asn)/Glu-tRNA(Gln) amidotransferase subunit GatB [Planctomycetota bacterium]
MTTPTATQPAISRIDLIVGLEIHVELATRTKMFSRALSPACAGQEDAAPNTYIDPVILALPGALPVMNRAALEMSMLVGLALNCAIERNSHWDHKSYFYPDLPKSYQISQYDRPIAGPGWFDLPIVDEQGFPDFAKPSRRVRILRAHLEEDAGKLLHEAPGGFAIDHSIVDYNRAGTPLLEIVTEPDFTSADDVALFCRLLRQVCRALGVTLGVMQKGHMRFEPNINCKLTLADGSIVHTPVVEIKNLNSFKAVKGAIEYELREQPRRWLEDRKVFGKGTKVTRGWDDTSSSTFVQREKEDAHDYRYFPDPDLLPVIVDDAWLTRIAAALPELPLTRYRRCVLEYGITVKEAAQLVEEPVKAIANTLLQSGMRRANERSCTVDQLGITPAELAELVALREAGSINNQSIDELFGLLCEAASTTTPPRNVKDLAAARGLLIVRDDAAMAAWIKQIIDANPAAAADVRAGKLQAAGRLVGEVMKLAAGKADAKTVREELLKALQG